MLHVREWRLFFCFLASWGDTTYDARILYQWGVGGGVLVFGRVTTMIMAFMNIKILTSLE